jgi:hypothetical protein
MTVAGYKLQVAGFSFVDLAAGSYLLSSFALLPSGFGNPGKPG